MLRTPFYDPLKTYEDNYEHGPFGDFADDSEVAIGEPAFDFLGEKITYPLGIPAGPLLNGKYVTAAFKKGFDVPVYKTVRATEFPCHPFPNVLSVKVDGDLTLEKAMKPLTADNIYSEPLSITNSFGVPSRPVPTWQSDATKAVKTARKGQVMVMSFMGTVKENQTADEFVADFAKAAEFAAATKAKILEANLSCPNIGNEGLVCYNLDMTRKVVSAIRGAIGALPLILKVGYYKDDESIEELAGIAKDYAQAICAINTVAAPIVDKDGNQALPGKIRLKSGVCGHAIKWAGLDMTRRLAKARAKVDSAFAVVGCGGLTVPEDFKEFRDAGADLVMTATGAMWNPYLAKEIRERYPNA